ncbi:MAG: hypothetical protein WCS37_13465 [Chloroflexota bacterium]|nr:hypothetical protein [Chloroflexota bacterium]
MSRPSKAAAGVAKSKRDLKFATLNFKRLNFLTVKWTWIGGLRLLLWVILLLVLMPRLLDFFTHSFEVLSWRWQVDYDEGLNLSASWHLSQGHNIYSNSIPERFIAAPYPPLYFILNALLIKLFGVSLLGGRLLTFGASLLIGLLIGFNVRLLSQRSGINQFDAAAAGLFAGLCWFCLPPPYIWSTFYKQDMVAIAIALAGLTLVYYWQDRRILYWVAPLLALGFFAKQNELSAIGVAGLYVVWREVLKGEGDRLHPDWRRALFFGLALVGLILIPFGLLNLLTKNGYYNHIIGYQLVPWNFDDLARRIGRLVEDHPVLLVLPLLYLLVALIGLVRKGLEAKTWVGRLLTLRPSLHFLYLLAATASLFTVGAYQGNYNLTLDLFPPVLILAGAALSWVLHTALKTLPSRPLRLYAVGRWLMLGLVVSGVVWQAFNFALPATYFSFGSLPGTERGNLMERLASDVRQAPGDFLTEDLYLPLSQGRAVPYDNLYHMRLQSEEGKWDDRLFLQDLRDRRFGLVLLEHNARRWSKWGWQTLNENYELVFPDGIDLWRPRSRPLAPQHKLEQCSLVKGQDRLLLEGFSLDSVTKPLHPGNGLTLTTYWKAVESVQNNYTFFIHLIDNSGTLMVQRDAEPDWIDLNVKAGEVPPIIPAPTSTWKPSSSSLAVDQSLPLPSTLRPGTYTLILGGYRFGVNGLENMQPECATANGSAIQLGQIKVE